MANRVRTTRLVLYVLTHISEYYLFELYNYEV